MEITVQPLPPPPPQKQYTLRLTEEEMKDLRAALDLVGSGPTTNLNTICGHRRSEINALWRQLSDARAPVW